MAAERLTPTTAPIMAVDIDVATASPSITASMVSSMRE